MYIYVSIYIYIDIVYVHVYSIERRVAWMEPASKGGVQLKRDREHSDWPIVVQPSDNAGNWPSLDKTAK